ncbi:folliculin-interacting protein 2 isoform X1 [Ostrinia nubilalis]|uniref:folliculin-interacting protein 2 isoform X1 n=1 Tax=Ostrinia nubilalis TaxID=29057 RepID=UPI0030822988
MALFDKFFSIKRKLDNDHRGSRNRARSCQINSEQVRLLLFKECDWRGRKLLFDSSTIEKVAANKNDKVNNRQVEEFPCIVEVSDGWTYLYKGPATDANILGEMIFGAVAVNCKRVSLKIHIMEEPKRLMCTKVFYVPTSRKVSRVDRKTSEASAANMRNGSKPLNVPSLREEGVSLSFSMDRGDSGFCGDLSPYSSVGSTCDYFSMFDIWDGKNSQDDIYSFHSPPGRKLSTSSNGSWQRRTFQNMATRFELGHQSSNLLSIPTAVSNANSSDSQVYSGSSTSGTTDSLLSAASNPQRKNKLGLALLFTVSDAGEMELVRRCVEHSPQLQALVCRLRLATLTAGAGGGFISTLYRATCDAARWMSDLMYGPRLQPMWLSLVTGDRRAASAAAENLVADLCSVLSVGDTKSTNFFMSTLLTHVLTYHLGWVTTVSPYDTVDPQKRSEVVFVAQRPYNALWAQLGDLCGSIGFPPRAARTVISGNTNTQFINRLLLVLTYFLRCGDVKRNNFQFQECLITETKVVDVKETGLKKSATRVNKLGLEQFDSKDSLKVPQVNTQNSDSSVSTLAASDVSIKRSATLANLSQKLSTGSELATKSAEEEDAARCDKPMTSQLRRNPTVMLSLKSSSDSSLYSSVSDESEPEQKVVFVLGDDEKLVGLKNKSNGGKSVKKSSKPPTDPADAPEACAIENCDRSSESPSKCCGQTLQHSKPIKHSGFKFEFDKYPQIVTNYMKSKNLEILDRHYIGKPGNLKLDNYQFDPTIVPPIQEERCEACYKCQLLESMLQTPTNASEMEYMNDMPQRAEPQYAKETIVPNVDTVPKTFVRKRQENTVVVNVTNAGVSNANEVVEPYKDDDEKKRMGVKKVVEFPVPPLCLRAEPEQTPAGFDASLLGGVTDHYVPDLILQGTISKSDVWEGELRRDLDLTAYLNKALDSPVQAVAIIGDTNNWCVRVVGREAGAGGMSSLVAAMLDALPAMRRARVPAHQCISFLEGKLREFCVLSKTLADMLMTTDFCDIATLTKSLSIDVNDVPLLLAIATTHTPQVAARYGISYR